MDWKEPKEVEEILKIEQVSDRFSILLNKWKGCRKHLIAKSGMNARTVDKACKFFGGTRISLVEFVKLINCIASNSVIFERKFSAEASARAAIASIFDIREDDLEVRKELYESGKKYEFPIRIINARNACRKRNGKFCKDYMKIYLSKSKKQG